VEESGAETSEKVTGLLEALQASLEAGKKHKPGSKRAGKLKTRPAGPEFMSKDELDKLAKELDIKGRSKMSKKDLIRAVEKASKESEASTKKKAS
jgi:DNA end-binding protein Ku